LPGGFARSVGADDEPTRLPPSAAKKATTMTIPARRVARRGF